MWLNGRFLNHKLECSKWDRGMAVRCGKDDDFINGSVLALLYMSSGILIR